MVRNFARDEHYRAGPRSLVDETPQPRAHRFKLRLQPGKTRIADPLIQRSERGTIAFDELLVRGRGRRREQVIGNHKVRVRVDAGKRLKLLRSAERIEEVSFKQCFLLRVAHVSAGKKVCAGLFAAGHECGLIGKLLQRRGGFGDGQAVECEISGMRDRFIFFVTNQRGELRSDFCRTKVNDNVECFQISCARVLLPRAVRNELGDFAAEICSRGGYVIGRVQRCEG